MISTMDVVKRTCVTMGLMLLLSCGYQVAAQDTMHTKGLDFESTSTYPHNTRGIFVFGDVIVDAGVVVVFRPRITHMSPVWLQIWRLGSNGQYSLVGQERLNPQAVNERYEVRPSQYIYTQAGDVLGIYNEEETCPIAYRFNGASAMNLLYYSTEAGRTINVGDSFIMQQIQMPYQFSVTVTYDTDVSKYQNPPVPGVTVPATMDPIEEPATTTTISNIPLPVGTVEYAGNSLHGKTSAITQSARGMYLLPHIKLPKAVVVSFFAYFVRSEPVCFQVLRLKSGEETYEVVGQKCYTPQYTPLLQEVSLSAGEYIFTEEGDQLGYINQAYTGSIGFKFLINPFTQGPWSAGLDATVPAMWDTITYDQSWLPYDFAIGLRYDTVIDNVKYGYPPVRPDPTTTTTTSTTTTKKPTMPTIEDRVLGMAYLQRADNVIASAARQTFLLSNLCFPQEALVTSFLFYPLRTGVIELQVWRAGAEENNPAGNRYTLIGQKRTQVTAIKEFRQVALTPEEEIHVKAGDCLGFATLNDTGVIGYVFEEVQLSFAEQVDGLEEGTTLTFDAIPFPYKFSIAATYKDVPPTTPEGSTNSTASTSSSTTYGSTESGEMTERPLTTTQRSQAMASTQDGPDWLTDRRFLLTLFIWLIILTVLFLVLGCYMACCRSKQERKAIHEAQRNSYMYGYPEILRNNSSKSNGGNSSRPNSSFKKYGGGQMRGQEVIDYFHPTIGGTGAAGVRRDDSMKRPLTRESSGSESFNGNPNGNGGIEVMEVHAVPYTHM